MDLAVMLLFLGCLLAHLSALVLDSNTIRSSTEIEQVPTKQESRCLADADCGPGRFCLTSQHEQPICSACRKLRRRCQRDEMCCSGSHCLNDVCVRSEGQAAAEVPSEATQARKAKGGNRPKKPSDGKMKEMRQKNQKEKLDKAQMSKGLEGETCLRTSDCSPGLCCARYHWSKICRPVLEKGQVCSKRARKEGPQGPEIFQRCNCGPGLACRNQDQGTSKNNRLRVCQHV